MDLENRTTRLEAVEEIKKLRANYCYFSDSFQTEALIDLFAEDAVFDFPAWLPEKLTGKAAIATFFLSSSSAALVMAKHHVTNPVIEVNGDTATGIWYALAPTTFALPEGSAAMWLQGKYDEEYVKINGTWKFKMLKFDLTFLCPYTDGWATKG